MPSRLFIALAPAGRVHAGLTLLRVVLGGVMAAHGGQKLFVMGFAGVAAGFESMGVPLPGITGPAIGVLEFFGGLALIAGILTPIVAGLLAMDMLTATLLVHLPQGFFIPGGVEFTLVLFSGLAAIALIGPGAWSADAMIEARRRPVTERHVSGIS